MEELDLSLSDALTDSVPQTGPESLVERDFVAQLESEIFDDQVGETVGKTDYIPLLDNDDTKADAGSTLENGEQEAHGVQKPGTGMNQSEKATPPVRSEVTKEHSPMKPEPQPPRSPLDLSAGTGCPEPAAFLSPHTGFFTSSSEQRTNCENPDAAAAGGDEREADGLDRKQQQKKKKKRRQKEDGFYEHLESRGKSETHGLEENISPTEEGSHWVRPQQDRGDRAWEEPMGKSGGRTKRVKSRKKPPEEFGVMADTFVPSSSASPQVTEEVLLDLGSPHTSPELAPYGHMDTKDISDPNLVPGPLSEDLFLPDSSLIPLVLNSELKATAAPFTMPFIQTLDSNNAESFDLFMTTENNINLPLSPDAKTTAEDIVDSGMSRSVHVTPDADTSAFSSASKSSPALSPYGAAVASAPPLSPSDASWLINESRMSSSSKLFDFSLETESPKPLRTPKTAAPVKRSPSPESMIPPSASSPPSAGVLGSGLNPSAKPFFPCFADPMKDDMTSPQVSPSIKDAMEKQSEQFEPLVEEKSVKLENVSSKTPAITDKEKHEEPVTEKEKIDNATKKTDTHTDEVEEQQKEMKKQEEREVRAQKEEGEPAQREEKETENKTQKKETAKKEETETAKEFKEIAKKEENVSTQREEKEMEKKGEKEIASKEEKETTQREEPETPKKEIVKKEEKEIAKKEEKETSQREKEDLPFDPQEKKSKASEEKKIEFKAEVETQVKKAEDLESDESKVREQGHKSTDTEEIKDVKEQLQIEKHQDQKEQQISISTSRNDEKVEKDDVQLKTPAEEQGAEKGNDVGKVKEMPSEEKEVKQVKQDKAHTEKKVVEKKVGQKPVKTDAEEKAKKTSKLTASVGSAVSGKDGTTAGKKSTKPVVGATKPAAKPGQGVVPTASTKRPPTSSTASTSDKKTSTLRAPSATAAAAPGTKRPPSSTTAARDLKPKTATAEKRPLLSKTSTVSSAGTTAASKTGGAPPTTTSTSRAPTSARSTLGARNPVATSSKTDSRPGEEKKSSTVRSPTVNSVQPKTSTSASRSRPAAPKAASAASSSEATAGKKLVAPSTTRPTASKAAAAARPGTAPTTRNTRTKISSTDNMKHEAAGGKAQMASKKIDFSHVTSRLGSKDNMKQVAGGGNVQILNKKVDMMKVASKCGSKDNIKHKPGGGDVKVDSHKVNIKGKTQTKVDPVPSVKTEGSSEVTGDCETATAIAPPPAPGPQLDQPGDANDSTTLDSFIPETN
ncbi:microtubule-associated protein 4-like isoform X2 [Gouania willdenowi]|uniref:microtubule-associated protein 4-like isoform X2 n=1 Tax=Gouania willdenowi TaxID=441366 RepID=UPI0010544E34|nr:microtubule-associated protein 4-like isoform X2 [Gouania willdenowi]